VVARQTAGAGLTGFEWAAGVPGSVGGAVRMNAGVPDAEVSDCLVRVRVVDLASGEDGVVPASELDLGYRTSSIRPDQIVVWAELELTPGDADTARAAIKEKTQWRRDHQPGGRNAGSVFTNPEGTSAGRLIDEAGCKGLRIGSAEVSPKHANFIQADEGGRAQDIWDLMVEVRRRVHARTGIALHPETCLVGFEPMPELDR
jgi:UDP-N-acetylmuramate dehydrogenase